MQEERESGPTRAETYLSGQISRCRTPMAALQTLHMQTITNRHNEASFMSSIAFKLFSDYY